MCSNRFSTKDSSDHGEEQISVVRELFTAELSERLVHLKIESGSAMDWWLKTVGTQTVSWTGLAPTSCTVAYNQNGKAVGWCGIGQYNNRISVINTYVEPTYRMRGIGSLLVQTTLDCYDEDKVIAYSEVGWDLSLLLKKAGIKHIPIGRVV